MNTEKLCKRCGKPFIPKERIVGKKVFVGNCCIVCRMRNLLDGLDLPTPPNLIDIHTKNPTFTEWEYKKKLNCPDGDEQYTTTQL